MSPPPPPPPPRRGGGGPCPPPTDPPRFGVGGGFVSIRKEIAMTLAEKILAAHAGKESVAPGELLNVRVDVILGNDITAPIAITEFRRLGVGVFDPKAIVMVADHFTPNKDIASAAQ